MPAADSDFLRACRSEPVEHVPVWFMRQAGRALPEYRAIRSSGTILEAIANPDVATEITLQPVRRYGVDAAILFSDIVVPVAAIGVGVEIVPGRGPVIAEPFRRAADLDRLRPLEPELDTPYVLETIANLVAELDVPLIGFAGAPFTVASYLVEGGPSRDFARTKVLMHSEPAVWATLLDRLADIAIASLRSQVLAGASAIQLFDSWAGALTRDEYLASVRPATVRVLDGVADLGVPRIHFGVGTGELLDLMAGAGADVVGVDWRVPLHLARERVGPRPALQGNLDPAICLAGFDIVAPEARKVLAELNGAPGHIFNLGHGVLPDTDPDVLTRVVELVHQEGRALDPGRVVDGSGAMSGPSRSESIGVVVMAYGTPRDRDDVLPYYLDIRRGRPPTPEQLADLVRRYDAIGGVSPLAARTRAQVAAITGALEAAAPGRYLVVEGAKHAHPKIEEAVAELAAQGCSRLVGLVLAPHYSAMSVGEYVARAREEAERFGIATTFIERWYDDEVLIEVLAERVTAAVATLGGTALERCELVVTAHSLPERILATGDRYPIELAETADLIAKKAGITRYRTGWQSAGRTAEPWIGPDILELLATLAGDGVEAVVVCPAGFTADHLEVLYDLDIEAKAVADRLGIGFARTAALNDEPRVAAALARRIVAAAEAAWP